MVRRAVATDRHAVQPDQPPELARELGVGDAVVVGLGAMIGAGVFAAIGPAADAGPEALLVGLPLAGAVAYANATSSAQLAAVHPASGGTYVYARERLTPFLGHLAGWGFVVGKTASCAAMAMTFGVYVAPELATPLAAGAVVALSVLSARGIRRTAIAMRIGLAVVLASLAAVVVASLTAPSLTASNLAPSGEAGVRDVLGAAGLLFFAFAGYARIATLGEEVRDPQRTIPRAVTLALGITVAVYVVVAASALAAVGADTLSSAEAPLAAAADAGRLPGLTPAVRVGGAVASLSVLLSLLAGVGRTSFAMARDRYLPDILATVHPRRHVPHLAQYAVGATVVVVVVLADLRDAIGFSSFAVLVYYAVTNAAALRLTAAERRWPRWLAAAGLVGCVALAASLPIIAVLGGVVLFALGALAYLLSRRRPPPAVG